MSGTVIVLTTRAKLPTLQAWQTAIDSHGFKVALDPSGDFTDHDGFWPAKYQGRAAGFELSNASPDEALEDYPEVEGKFDIAFSFVTDSNMDEACSSWLAASALAHLTGGVLLDDSSGDAIPGADALEWARELEKTAQEPA